jgi:hypothetical protein
MSKARDIASAPIAPSTVSATELGYVDGVTSAIQTQLDAKTAKSTLTTTGDIYYASAANTPARLGIGSTDQVLKVTAGIPSWATASAGGMTLISETVASGLSSLDLSSIPGTYKELYVVFSGIYHSNSTSTFKLRFNNDSGSNYYCHNGQMRSDSQVREENTLFTNADGDGPLFAGNADGGSNLLKSCVGTVRITNYASTSKYKYYQLQYAQDTNLDYVNVNHGIWADTAALTSLNWFRSAGAGTFSNETNTSILLYGVS